MTRRQRTIVPLTVLLLLTWFAATLWAAGGAKQHYFEAEAYYKKLRKDSARQRYRDQWLRGIDKFESVFRLDPDGPWAAAGLYMSAQLYQELYRHSQRLADRQEARDIYQRIVNRFPHSRYHQKSRQAIRALDKAGGSVSKKKPSTTATASKNGAKNKYLAAQACYRKLQKSAAKQKYRENWLECIHKYQAVYQHDPGGPWAAAGLYMSAQRYLELYQHSFRPADRRTARDIFETIVAKYPSSRYHSKSLSALEVLPKTTDVDRSGQKTVKAQTQATPADPIAKVIDTAAGKESTPATTGGKVDSARVTGLRHWSNPNYTRVVIDTDNTVEYSHRLLKKDTRINKPQRLYVDLTRCRLAPGVQKMVPINDNLLSDARAGQYDGHTVRVVVDIKNYKTYKIFSLRNPFRIVIDVWGSAGQVQTAVKSSQTPSAGGSAKVGPGAIAKQLALGVSRIVVDPGHGGHDPGAKGYLKGVREKNVVLQIGRRLAKKIREQIGCEVIMTRNSDRYLTLEERTAIANTKNADLFISLHTNAHRDPKAYGLETYFLNLATDDDAILVAARENATSTKNISDLETILNDLMQNAKINESSRLAHDVQKALYAHMKFRYSRIKNKGVKQAPFYVLLGAQMPAILVETSFISNPRECKRLTTAAYQDQLCDGIIKGIQQYIKEIHPTAHMARPPAGEDKS